MIQLYILAGLMLAIGILSVIYMYWLREWRSYSKLPIPDETLVKIGEVTFSEGECGEEVERVGEIVVFRSEKPLSPLDLTRKVERLIAEKYGEKAEIYPLSLQIEPGYNVFRAMDKQKDWFRSAIWSWESSYLHALLFPFEVVLRWAFLPHWILFDFFDHVGKGYAAVVCPKGTPRPEGTPSFVEGYDGIYCPPSTSPSSAAFSFHRGRRCERVGSGGVAEGIKSKAEWSGVER